MKHQGHQVHQVTSSSTELSTSSKSSNQQIKTQQKESRKAENQISHDDIKLPTTSAFPSDQNEPQSSSEIHTQSHKLWNQRDISSSALAHSSSSKPRQKYILIDI